MMNTRLLSGLGVAVVLAVPQAGRADLEISGYLKNETAVFTQNAQTIGQAVNTLDESTSSAGLMKFENSLKLFVNADLTDNMSFHGEANIIYDTEGLHRSGSPDYRDHLLYSQHDWLREYYIDASIGDTAIRVGKQQVVWGTADGIKLLDIINPTDFREFNQNTFEDSRIPIHMINIDTPIGDTGSLQLIASQHEENKIPGLNPGGDQGHPFVMKGVDSITGKVNGFFNIAPALAGVASNFSEVARTGASVFGGGFGFDGGDGTGAGTGDGAADDIATGLTSFGGLTVDGFAGRSQFTNAAGSVICSDPQGCGATVTTATPGGTLLNSFAQSGASFGLPFSNSNATSLTDPVFNTTLGEEADTTFEYMPNATFATFNTFAGNRATGLPATVTEYVRDYPDDLEPNAGMRFRQSLDNGLNFSLNYFYHYDANPVIETSWHDAVTGEQLTTVLARNGAAGGGAYFPDPNGAFAGGGTVSPDAVPNSFTLDAFGNVTNATSVLLRNSAGLYYGAVSPNPTLPLSGRGTVLRFTESLNRIHSFGTSFDYAVDSFAIPTVVRGEFLYDRDVKLPVVDKRLLAIGDLEGGLRPYETDLFKYVIGVDLTVFTNLLISGQFIQFIDLDYQDADRTCTTQLGNSFDCSRYTADAATLHLSNGLQQGEEFDNFGSLFFSKPFGPSQEHRWNNITIYEEGGGIWNRFDVEYTFMDELIGTAEWNWYGGDRNTTFGQMHNSSNVQVGLKYIF